MNFEQKKKYLLDRYPKSDTWKRKVQKMSEAQVSAIYLSLIKRK